ncbi:lipoate--protein ligase family protein [Enterococcus cecorum]|uniref:lipoate--protein ligase family protein n=1 Tax=Enterococcus cecorum TaxID=44008 RepID=UPI003B96FA4B
MKCSSLQSFFKSYMDKIIEALHTLGVEVAYNSRNDLAINGKKISGNAQCNKGEYTIHRGSLLYDMDFSKMAKYLNPPKYKIESKGIKSVRNRTGNISDCLSKK